MYPGMATGLAHVLGVHVAQQALRFADVGQAVTHLARAKFSLHRLGALQMRVIRQPVLVQLAYSLLSVVRSPTATL